MSLRPVSPPVVLREQRERVGWRTASHVFASRECGWGRGVPDEPGAEMLT